jgi:acyl carrier protein
MGLDGIELVMAVEDRFGISIKDAEATGIRTVGDLVALVHSRILAATAQPCATMRAFLMCRRLVRDVVHDEDFRVLPRDNVASWLDPGRRRKLWHRLPEILGTSPTSLRRPPLLRRTLAALSISLHIVAIAFASIDWQILPLTLFLATLLSFLLHLATSGYCRVPPAGWTTIAEIANRVAGTIAAKANLQLVSEQSVLLELRPIIAETLGVKETAVVSAARFIEDLGMG